MSYLSNIIVEFVYLYVFDLTDDEKVAVYKIYNSVFINMISPQLWFLR